MTDYEIIGKRLPRIDGMEKVTGAGKYSADFSLPDMLWCKVLRAPFPHARILNIDVSKALKLPGVKAVVTGKDFGGWKWGWMPATRDESPLAVDKVRYMAEAVAGVGAIDEDIAEEACDLIKVDYEELPGVFDPEEAMLDGAPKVHDYVKNNISVEYHWNFGDVDKAFANSDYVREDRFKTARVTKGYLEPPATLAYYDPTGAITVWPAKQSPYFHYRHLAACFKLPLSKIRVVQPLIGGGFGGTKNDSIAGDFCAVQISKMTGRPVKYIETMEEELCTSRRRHSMIVYSKIGVKKDGTLTAIQHRVVADGGAYTAIGPLTMFLAGNITTLPYHLPNYKYDCYRVFTNNPIMAAMRGHGSTHTRYPIEIQLEMIAEDLGIDPAEIRMRNAIDNPKPGTVYKAINNVSVKTCGIKECFRLTNAHPLWKNRDKVGKEGDITWGVGMSGTTYSGGARQMGHQACGAIVRICEDGTVNLITGATDVGQGSDTVLCMIAAEELGIKYEDITIKRVDTAYTPVDPGSYGSRVTILAGQATQKAARAAKIQLIDAAAKSWGVPAGDVQIRGGTASSKTDSNKSMPFERLARIACYSGTGNVILGTGTSSYGLEPLDFFNGTGDSGVSYSFASQIAKVGVDLETGKTVTSDFVIASDSGRLLAPLVAESQIEGAAIQGLGQTIYEEFHMHNGKTYNPTFLDYKMPHAGDIPNIELIDVVTDDPDGPFGAKEVSEASIVGTPPAMISAIHSATGIWFKELPVTPEKIVMALKEKKKTPKPKVNK